MFSEIDRLFVFGCSFTQWCYPTWADILATSNPNIEYYNYATGGAGNQFIFTKLQQADINYKFTKRDLVIVQWTNIRREDRFFDDPDKWITPGNIYTQHLYDDNYVEKYVNDCNSALRDYTFVYASLQLLQYKTNFKFLQMVDIFESLDQWETETTKSSRFTSIVDFYKPHITPFLTDSFYQVLWSNNIDNKRDSVITEFHPDYSDFHPSILEHANFVISVFNIKLPDDVWEKVISADNYYKKLVNDYFENDTSNNAMHLFFAQNETDIQTYVCDLFEENLVFSSLEAVSI